MPTLEGNIWNNNTLKIDPVDCSFVAVMISNVNLYDISPTLFEKPDPRKINFKIHVEVTLSFSILHSDAFLQTDDHESSSQAKPPTR